MAFILKALILLIYLNIKIVKIHFPVNSQVSINKYWFLSQDTKIRIRLSVKLLFYAETSSELVSQARSRNCATFQILRTRM